MGRLARGSRSRRSSSTASFFFVIAVFLLAGLGIGILLWDLNVESRFASNSSTKPDGGGKVIIGKPEGEPKENNELTFYQTLTDKTNKEPPADQFQTKKSVPNPPQEAVPRPAPSLSDQGSGSLGKRYTLQVGSFMEKDTAQRLVSKLIGKGYPAYLVMAKLSDQGIRYRVRVGSFADKVQAKSQADRLEREEGLKSFVAFADEGAQ